MSGHSHAKTIRHQKNITDQKRGQFFSKMAQVISVAVKQGGSNPETNYKLKVAFEKAKEFNMPKENVERAVKQALGGVEGASLEEVVFEAFGPGGVAIIVEAITDNKNRTLGEIKQILNQHNGKLANEGSVKWLFERKGCLTINLSEQTAVASREELELKAIESGAEDIDWQEDSLDVYIKPENLETTKKDLESKGIKVSSTSLDWTAKEEVILEKEEEKAAYQKLFETLDDNEAVQGVYYNIKM